MIQAEKMRVVDDTMTDVPADGNTMGEIVMRGNNVMAGYYRDPEATAGAFRGGWFHSRMGRPHPPRERLDDSAWKAGPPSIRQIHPDHMIGS
jgi:hypothetical protein